MPLSDPAPREAPHRRTIECRGARREDGPWDIEAQITDVKTYAFENNYRGTLRPGDPIHHMRLRLTLDDDFVIHGAEAATDASPFAVCPAITPAFAKLEGLIPTSGAGWSRAVRERLGGVNGCTHLVALLLPLGTVAFQTIRARRGENEPGGNAGRKPSYIDKCHALDSRGDVVRENFPEWYSSPE